MRVRKQKIKGISQMLEEFNSLKRWKKMGSSFITNKKDNVQNIKSKEFLIRKYESKFPNISSDQTRRDVIRL